MVPAVELLISAILWFSPWDGMGLLPEPVIVSSETWGSCFDCFSIAVQVLGTNGHCFTNSVIGIFHVVYIENSKAMR